MDDGYPSWDRTAIDRPFIADPDLDRDCACETLIAFDEAILAGLR